MKVFRELYLHLPEVETDSFFSKLGKTLNENWFRDIELEERSVPQTKPKKFYYFSCVRTEILEPAFIAFTRKNDEIVYVANIIPREVGQLSKEQYNNILMEFYNNFLQPICKQYSVQVEGNIR